MSKIWQSLFAGFDPLLFGAALSASLFGIATMYSHVGENSFFNQQLIWLLVSVVVFFAMMVPDYRSLRTTNAGFYFYLVVIVLLILTPFLAEEILGARQRFDFGFFSLQVSDPAKLVLIIVLSK